MFHVVICLSDSNMCANFSSEIEGFFLSKGIYASILSFTSSKQILRHGIKALRPDIFIFDLEDEQGQTFQLARLIKKHYPHVINLLTGITSLGSLPDLSCLEPVYSSRDYSTQDLYSLLFLAYEQNLKDQDNFNFFRRSSFFSHPINEILYFSSEGRRTHLITLNYDDIPFYKKLDSVESQLHYKKCMFIRIHKSFLVNVKFISDYDRYSITLLDGSKLGISKSIYYHNLKAALQ